MVVIGLLTLFAVEVAAPLLDVISWIMGTLGASIVTLDMMFPLVKHTWLRDGWKYGKYRLRVRYMDVLALSIGLGLVLAWWFTDKNWILSDVLSCCIVMAMVKVFKIVSLKIALFSSFVVLGIFIIGTISP